jgi:hypothetical protein
LCSGRQPERIEFAKKQVLLVMKLDEGLWWIIDCNTGNSN